MLYPPDRDSNSRFSSGPGGLDVRYIDSISYADGLALQKELHAKRVNEEIRDTLLLLQHEHVFTLGRRGSASDILISDEECKNQGIDVFSIERGGETTYHGPGQLVGYLIINLYKQERRIKEFMWTLEEVLIQTCSDFGIQAERDEKHPGVWVGNKKIAAIGISIKNKVSMHGFAFNITTDLSFFNKIIPCGITDKGVCSLESLLNKQVDFNETRNIVEGHFRRLFMYNRESL